MKIERTLIHFYGTFSPPSRRRRILGPVNTYPFLVFEKGDFFVQFNLAFRPHVSGENSFLVLSRATRTKVSRTQDTNI